MLSTIRSLVLALVLACAVQGFAPARSSSSSSTTTTGTALNMIVAPAAVPPPTITTAAETGFLTKEIVRGSATSSSIITEQSVSPLQYGVENYLSRGGGSSVQVALQERKIPTKEEIEAKKRNFNVIFWGGGFVAPFLATIFYFGFKFWEK